MWRARVFSKRLFSGLLLLLLWGLPAGAKPELKIEASPRQLSLGQTLNLNLTLIQEASEKGAMFDTPTLSLPPLPGLEVLGQQSSSSMIANGSRMRMTHQLQYRLRPLKSGDIVIPSLTFQYAENGRNQEVSSQPLTIRVTGGGASGPVGWALGGVLILGAAGLALVLLRRKKLAGSVPEPVAKQPPAVIHAPAAKVAKNATPMDSYEARLNRGEDPRVLLEEVYEWFRELALKRQWALATGASHQEMLNTLRYATGMPKPKVQAVEQFLQACDQMRFANHDVAPERLRHLFELARQFY